MEDAARQQSVKQTEHSQLEQRTVSVDSTLSDSTHTAMDADRLGVFATSGQGKEELVTLENEVLKITFTNRGGRIKSAELKKYKTFEGKPVKLFESDSTRFGLNFFSQNRNISTNDLFFTPVLGAQKSLAMRLNAGENKYLEYVYSIDKDSYLIKYKINFVNLNQVIAANTSSIELDWTQQLQRMEKDVRNERMNSSVYYQFTDEIGRAHV